MQSRSGGCAGRAHASGVAPLTWADPGSERRLCRDLVDRAVRDAQEDELRRRVRRAGCLAPRAARSPPSRRARARPRSGFVRSFVCSSSRSGYRAAEVCPARPTSRQAAPRGARARPATRRRSRCTRRCRGSRRRGRACGCGGRPRRSRRAPRARGSERSFCGVGLPLDATAAPDVERVPQLEVLRLDVHPGAPHRRMQPRPPDLDGAVLRPEGEEAGRADDLAVAHGHERESRFRRPMRPAPARRRRAIPLASAAGRR